MFQVLFAFSFILFVKIAQYLRNLFRRFFETSAPPLFENTKQAVAKKTAFIIMPDRFIVHYDFKRAKKNNVESVFVSYIKSVFYGEIVRKEGFRIIKSELFSFFHFVDVAPSCPHTDICAEHDIVVIFVVSVITCPAHSRAFTYLFYVYLTIRLIFH